MAEQHVPDFVCDAEPLPRLWLAGGNLDELDAAADAQPGVYASG
jgi:hypothetical protein